MLIQKIVVLRLELGVLLLSRFVLVWLKDLEVDFSSLVGIRVICSFYEVLVVWLHHDWILVFLVTRCTRLNWPAFRCQNLILLQNLRHLLSQQAFSSSLIRNLVVIIHSLQIGCFLTLIYMLWRAYHELIRLVLDIHDVVGIRFCSGVNCALARWDYFVGRLLVELVEVGSWRAYNALCPRHWPMSYNTRRWKTTGLSLAWECKLLGVILSL